VPDRSRRPVVGLAISIAAASGTALAVPLAVRRRADVIFNRAKVAVLVDGCIWHRCPEHALAPRNNARWWREKLDRNVAREREVDRALTGAGWVVLPLSALAEAAIVRPALDALGLTLDGRPAARRRPGGGARSSTTSFSTQSSWSCWTSIRSTSCGCGRAGGRWPAKWTGASW